MEGWLTQSQAARIAGVHRGSIGRAVERGELFTNGALGRLMRINPVYLERYMRRRLARLRRLKKVVK